MRTQPMSTDSEDSSWSVPSANSVDPPPMSTTSVRPSIGGRSRVAPLKLSCASSLPLISSGAAPRISVAGPKKSVAVGRVA